MLTHVKPHGQTCHSTWHRTVLGGHFHSAMDPDIRMSRGVQRGCQFVSGFVGVLLHSHSKPEHFEYTHDAGGGGSTRSIMLGLYSWGRGGCLGGAIGWIAV